MICWTALYSQWQPTCKVLNDPWTFAEYPCNRSVNYSCAILCDGAVLKSKIWVDRLFDQGLPCLELLYLPIMGVLHCIKPDWYKPMSMTPPKVGRYHPSQRDLAACYNKGVPQTNQIAISLSSQYSPLLLCKSFFWWCCIVLDPPCPKSEVCISWSLYQLYVLWSQHLATERNEYVVVKVEFSKIIYCSALFVLVSHIAIANLILLPSPHYTNKRD